MTRSARCIGTAGGMGYLGCGSWLMRLHGVLCGLVLLGLTCGQSLAAGVLRVGFFPLEGFHGFDAAEQPQGYDVEYLGEISRRTGWSFRFVAMGSWHEAVQQLKEGQIDLLGAALMVRHRMDEMLYSAFPVGSTHGVMVTLKKRDPFVYEDFQTFSTLRVGMTQAFARVEAFRDYARQNGFTPALREYADTASLRAALSRGEIDAMLLSVLEQGPDEKVLARFGYEPFYYVMAPGHLDVMEELNKAIGLIKTELPDFETRLMRRYFPHSFEQPLTQAERELIVHLPALRVGYYPGRKPLAYQNPQTDEALGMVPDMMRLLAETSGLRFEFVPVLPPLLPPSEAMTAFSLDMVAGVADDPVNRAVPHFVLTKSMLTSGTALFGRVDKAPGTEAGPELTGRVVVPEGWFGGLRHVAASYPGLEAASCGDVEDCLNRVVRAEADWTFQTVSSVSYLLPKPLYRYVSALPGSGESEELCIAVDARAPARLVSILNKSVDALSEHQRRETMAANLAVLTMPLSVADFWAHYREAVLIIAALLLLVLTLLSFALHVWRKSERAALENERCLSAITNNINGGVMTLSVEPEPLIVYANNGFWQLLGEPCAAQHSCRMVDHLRKEDADELASLMRQSLVTREPLEMELTLRHKEGMGIPVLFRGSFEQSEAGSPYLYAVVMDIAAQKRMHDRLAMEKERYRIILEQSNDIVFDIDEERDEFSCSENFAATFGWQWSRSFFLPPLPAGAPRNGNEFRTHPEDLPTLSEARQRLHDGERLQTVLLRIPTAAGAYRWCRVQISRLNTTGQPLRIIGKIVDVDDTVREREALERQSQRDSLTDLYNKVTFIERVNVALQERRDDGLHSAILFLDLDNFKTLNDTLGHITGDKALIAVGDVLRRVFRNADAIGRFGGDEFCVFVNHIPQATLLERAEAIRAALQLTYTVGSSSVTITVSIGIYLLDETETSCEEALGKADEALYAAKEGGRNTFVFYDSLPWQGTKRSPGGNEAGSMDGQPDAGR